MEETQDSKDETGRPARPPQDTAKRLISHRRPVSESKLCINLDHEQTLTRRNSIATDSPERLKDEALTPRQRHGWSGRDILVRALSGDLDTLYSPLSSPSLYSPSLNSPSVCSLASVDPAWDSVVNIAIVEGPLGINIKQHPITGCFLVVDFVNDENKLSGPIERTSKVKINDVLYSIGREPLTGKPMKHVVRLLKSARFPLRLQFRRWKKARRALGSYNLEEIAKLIRIRFGKRSPLYKLGSEQAARYVDMWRGLLSASDKDVPIELFLAKCEHIISRESYPDVQEGLEDLKGYLALVHRHARDRQKKVKTQWASEKLLLWRKIRAMENQRDILQHKIVTFEGKIRSRGPSSLSEKDLNTYQEIKILHKKTSDDAEKSKQHYYVPEHSGYRFRFGSEGVYIGIRDLWIKNLVATYKLTVCASSPHVVIELSGTASKGASISVHAKQLKLAGEMVPNVKYDELNVDTEVQIRVPLAFDVRTGWNHIASASTFKVRKLKFDRNMVGETRVLKMIINQVLPTVLSKAVCDMLPPELGPLILSGSLKTEIAGELNIVGLPIEWMDEPISSESLRKNSNMLNQFSLDEGGLQEFGQLFASLCPMQMKWTRAKSASMRDLVAYESAFGEDEVVWSTVLTLLELGWRLYLSSKSSNSMRGSDRVRTMSLAVSDCFQKIRNIASYPLDFFTAVHELNVEVSSSKLISAAQEIGQRLQKEKEESSTKSSVGATTITATNERAKVNFINEEDRADQLGAIAALKETLELLSSRLSSTSCVVDCRKAVGPRQPVQLNLTQCMVVGHLEFLFQVAPGLLFREDSLRKTPTILPKVVVLPRGGIQLSLYSSELKYDHHGPVDGERKDGINMSPGSSAWDNYVCLLDLVAPRFSLDLLMDFHDDDAHISASELRLAPAVAINVGPRMGRRPGASGSGYSASNATYTEGRPANKTTASSDEAGARQRGSPQSDTVANGLKEGGVNIEVTSAFRNRARGVIPSLECRLFQRNVLDLLQLKKTEQHQRQRLVTTANSVDPTSCETYNTVQHDLVNAEEPREQASTLSQNPIADTVFSKWVSSENLTWTIRLFLKVESSNSIALQRTKRAPHESYPKGEGFKLRVCGASADDPFAACASTRLSLRELLDDFGISVSRKSGHTERLIS